MKESTRKIITVFPMLEKHLMDRDSTLLSDQTLSNLNDTEQTFLRLAWFFENPNNENFNLETIYKNLDSDWIVFALETIYTFFANDTFLVKNTQFSVITEDSEYLNQAEFAQFLTENGFVYSRSKFNTYFKRGVVPGPDLSINKTTYWSKKTCQNYLNELKKESHN